MKRYLSIILVIVMAMSVTACGSAKNTDSKKVGFDWEEGSVANVLPHPETDKIEIMIDDEESFYATVEGYSEEDYKAYVEKCKQKGFEVDSESDNMSFDAYNDEGYKLSLIYFGESGLSIELEAPKGFDEFKWPSSEIAKLLPKPKSNVGKIEWETSYGFVIYVSETSLEEYNAYVEECSKNGFTVDYQKGDDYYYGDNADGYHLSLKYEGNNTMFVRIDEPDNTEDADSKVDDNVDEEVTIDESNNSKDKDSKKDKNTKETSEGVSPEFKKAMDSYEAFFDEYVKFMKKYMNADSDDMLSMASDYADYMKKYTETMEAMNEINEDELSTADALYYAEVNARISVKLLEVAE